ncbi:MAG: TlpA disulfide reductase family protein [Planctomycetota bacterium]
MPCTVRILSAILVTAGSIIVASTATAQNQTAAELHAEFAPAYANYLSVYLDDDDTNDDVGPPSPFDDTLAAMNAIAAGDNTDEATRALIWMGGRAAASMRPDRPALKDAIDRLIPAVQKPGVTDATKLTAIDFLDHSAWIGGQAFTLETLDRLGFDAESDEVTARLELAKATNTAIGNKGLDPAKLDELQAELSRIIERFPGTNAADVARDYQSIAPDPIGTTAPLTFGADRRGTTHQLADYEGRVVVLHFWSFWCGACRQRLPEERALVESYADRPFALIGMNGDFDPILADVYTEMQDLDWPNILIGSSFAPIVRRYGFNAWPTFMIIDHTGTVRYLQTFEADELEAAVAELVAEAESAAIQ